jgi:hypothetical protein
MNVFSLPCMLHVPTSFMLFDLINIIMFEKEHNYLCSSLLYNFHRPHITFSLLGPNNLLGSSFSGTPQYALPLGRAKTFTHIQNNRCMFNSLGFWIEDGNLKEFTCLSGYVDLYGSNITIVCSLYECETWSFTLREEQRLRVFENRVLRRIYGPKVGWRRLHNKKLHN